MKLFLCCIREVKRGQNLEAETENI